MNQLGGDSTFGWLSKKDDSKDDSEKGDFKKGDSKDSKDDF